MKIKTNKIHNKGDKAKEQFLQELKGALLDVKKAEAKPDKQFSEVFGIVKKSHGGTRVGAGAKKSGVTKVQRGVKLSEPEYKFIVKKFGSFAGGVRSLLPKDLSAT
jgi:hypothetical protein